MSLACRFSKSHKYFISIWTTTCNPSRLLVCKYVLMYINKYISPLAHPKQARPLPLHFFFRRLWLAPLPLSFLPPTKSVSQFIILSNTSTSPNVHLFLQSPTYRHHSIWLVYIFYTQVLIFIYTCTNPLVRPLALSHIFLQQTQSFQTASSLGASIRLSWAELANPPTSRKQTLHPLAFPWVAFLINNSSKSFALHRNLSPTIIHQRSEFFPGRPFCPFKYPMTASVALMQRPGKFDSSRSDTPDSLRSATSSQSIGSSASVAIHPTLLIRDQRRRPWRGSKNAYYKRHRLTESDFGYRPSTSLSTKILQVWSPVRRFILSTSRLDPACSSSDKDFEFMDKAKRTTFNREK